MYLSLFFFVNAITCLSCICCQFCSHICFVIFILPVLNCVTYKFLISLMKSEKTFLMSTPKHLGAQIWQMKCSDCPPPIKTARGQSELFALQWCKWEPIWNSQLIRKHQEIAVHRIHLDTKGRMTPPIKTARRKSDLFTLQCHQWEPIRNSQVIRKYI